MRPDDPRFPFGKVLPLALGLALSACATFPELDAAVSADAMAAPYPAIAPLDAVLAGAKVAQITPATSAALAARAAALRARAEALRRGQVIP